MSDNQFKAWHESLSPDLRAQIRSLHALDRRWNLIAVFFLVNWAVAGWMILTWPGLPVRLIGTLWIGVSIHALANLMHEASHGNLFRKPRLDRLVGFLCGAPAFIAFSAYRVTHTDHHRHLRTERDPDEFSNLTGNRRALSFLFYVWLFVGTLIYLVHVPITAFTRGTRRDRRRCATEYGALVVLYATVVGSSLAFDFWKAVVAVWLVPMIVASFFANLRGWAEHMLTRKGHPLTESRTVTSNRLFSLFNINLNYHAEHHLYAGMPWYNLPKLHRLLLPEYRKLGTSIYRSYVLFLLDAARFGVHGLAPKEQRTPVLH